MITFPSTHDYAFDVPFLHHCGNDAVTLFRRLAPMELAVAEELMRRAKRGNSSEMLILRINTTHLIGRIMILFAPAHDDQEAQLEFRFAGFDVSKLALDSMLEARPALDALSGYFAKGVLKMLGGDPNEQRTIEDITSYNSPR